ncbi:MAG TPA: hypothetical protein ENH91_04400 [Leeuwenhoekiella sp.]|nr:hypothetical protein [Leeuwenhoekiella sp.]
MAIKIESYLKKQWQQCAAMIITNKNTCMMLIGALRNSEEQGFYNWLFCCLSEEKHDNKRYRVGIVFKVF